MVVPFAPGGGTDVLGRIIAQRLAEQRGQPVVIENQPGASGGIGTRAAAKAEPDGYTLLMASTGALMAASAALSPEGHFDVTKFFAPITMVAAPPYLVAINPKVPANSISELIGLARVKPKALSFGSSGIGAASHLSGALFQKDAKIELLHVPYKGTGPAVTDLLGGRIDMMFSPSTTVQAFVAGGKLKALAVTSAKRSKFFPQIPTVAESGLPGYESVGWFGLLAPAHTPKEIVDKLNKAVVAIMGEKDVIDHMAKLGAEPEPQSPDEFARYINADVAKWSALVKEQGITIPGGGK
jgi:tripartite-type tricarboxylate transporter receptor subunit TctC